MLILITIALLIVFACVKLRDYRFFAFVQVGERTWVVGSHAAAHEWLEVQQGLR